MNATLATGPQCRKAENLIAIRPLAGRDFCGLCLKWGLPQVGVFTLRVRGGCSLGDHAHALIEVQPCAQLEDSILAQAERPALCRLLPETRKAWQV